MDIAYTMRGTGRPVFVLPFHSSNVDVKWTAAHWAPGLAERNRVIGYDSRGQGLSTRNLGSDPSIADYRSDLEAVIEGTGVDRAVFVAYGGFAHVALHYAVDHPERVDALVLICTCESFSAWPLAGMQALMEENWDLFLELIVARAPAEEKQALMSRFKKSTTKDDYIRLVRGFSVSSVSDILEHVQLPVLILHSLDQHWLDVDEGTRFAAKVKGARLVFLNGDIEPNDSEGVRAIQAFLDELPRGTLDGSASTAAGASFGTLSPRQQDVLKLISLGKTTREIAEELVLSDRTVERHISDVYAKIGAANRASAIAYALRELPQG
jgi:pimeloyl-ACP methyl ester carboxylesterase/DNA-binding CsgD family transcriptional regulator